MTGFLQETIEAIALEIERFRNRDFLEATMAAAALVATADGEPRFAARAKIDEIVETVRALRIYDPHEAVDLYRAHAEALRERPEAARAAILDAVKRVADEPETARILIRACLAIGTSDDPISAPERAAIGAICDALGVARAEADP